MAENVTDEHRRALADYRIALGLELRERRTDAELSLAQLGSRAHIPPETLRAYERGSSLPQLVRVTDIGRIYGVSAFDILESAAKYVYRATGEPPPGKNSISQCEADLRSIILYCGVSPTQLSHVLSMNGNGDSGWISDDLFGNED